MINIPYESIIEKITEEADISKDELEEKIKKKTEQLSGLISKEGAAHIIAKELNVNLMKSDGLIKIKDLLQGMRQIDLTGKVIRKYDVRTFENEKRSGKIGKFLLGDETGITMIVLWNDKADLMEKFKEDDVLKLKSVTARDNNGRVELHLNDESEIEINPKGVEIDAQKPRQFGEPTRKKITDLKENDENVEIFGTIVQVFDPKFWPTDKETGRKVDPQTTKPTGYGAVLNMFVDDGSDNIRVVLWKNQILNLIGKSEEELEKYKDSPDAFEEIKTNLLGVMAKIIGRVSNNEMFNRLELVAQRITQDVDPEDEMKKLDETKKDTQKTEDSSPTADSQNTEKSDSSVQNADSKTADNSDHRSPAADDDLDEELMSLEDIDDV